MTTLVVQDNRKRSSAEAKLTKVSPANEVLNHEQPPMLEWKEPGVIAPAEGQEVRQKLTFEDGDGGGSTKTYEQRSGTPPPPPSAREQKRSKKHVTPKKDKTMTESAGLEVVPHRDQ